MGWARLDDQRADNPKLMAAGFEARGLDEAAICWCARHETDGVITEGAVAMLAAGHGCRNWRRITDRLVDVGRWHPTTGGWEIHDYLDYNPSRAERDAERDRKREAGRIGGRRSGEARAKQPASSVVKQNLKQPASDAANPRPDPDPTPIPIGFTETHDPPNTSPQDQTTPPTDPRDQALIDRWLTIIHNPTHLAHADAQRWIPHLATILDRQIIDQLIGQAQADSTNPPQRITYLAATARQWARDNLPGVTIPNPPITPRGEA